MKAKAQRARPAASRKPAGCPIVGIGASAGGLEAFTALLKQLPLDTGFGFVLVQHLDPQHESALTQLLARATAMPVREAINRLRVEANHVYIIPPNATLTITRGVLRLQPRARDGLASRTIDHFLESLALDLRERAIGVILSGSATDGTLGLEAIKAEGGLTFAQDGSARYDSMPRSAAAAGCVDFVLAPGKIARELARIARHPLVAAGSGGRRVPRPSRRVKPAANPPARRADPETEQAGYQKILQLLHNHSGVDFSLYKTTTIHRRMTRRAVLNRSETLAKYAAFLQGNTKELDALYSDSLINVTSFFRNPEAFAVLKQKVFAPLLRQQDDEPIRVWVLGCSTGQEAYSIAMAYAEAAGKSRRSRPLQVFATDLNEANLQKARQGFYAKSLAQDLSAERLRRFFIEEPDGFQVIKTIREQVVFARHNLISDPPFSRMDLISCRNLMIYLEPSLQKKAVPAFHYALKPAGALLLGASESVGGFSDLFAPLDKKNKLFVKKAAPTQSFQLPVKSRPGRPRPAATPPPLGYRAGPAAAYQSELNAEREADRVTLNQFAPPSVLIDDRFQILQFRGPTGTYLEPPTGKASFDLMKMAREGLMLPLRATIGAAQRQNATTRKENVPFNQDGRIRAVHLEVVPLKNLKEPRFLVLFEDATPPPPYPSAAAAPGAVPARRSDPKADSSRIIGLERDLAETRDYLQSVQEHQESANEELQASHEEGQSANEELQSLNEELETSKEELESTNEELTTVNEEMVSRNAELNRVNSDLTNLQASTKLVIVLLGRDLSIRRFSTEAKKQFHLLNTDVGAPFRHIRHNLDFPELEQFMSEVITSVREHECEVRDREGRWYSLRVSPYLTVDNKVDGAVLVLVDINSLKTTEQEATHARDFSEAIIETARDPLLILDSSFRIHKANQAYFKSFAISAKAVLNRSLFEINRGQWDLPGLRQRLKQILPKDTSFDDFEVTLPGIGQGRRTLLLNGRTLSQAPGHREKILLGIQDMTEILHFQARLRKSELRYRRLFEAAQDGILMLDPATRKITEANPYIVKLLGYSRDQLIKKELWQIGLLKDEAASQEAFRELKANGFIRYEDLPLKSRQGQRLEVEFVSNLYDEDGQPVIQCNIRNITERKQNEELLRLSEERYRNLFNSIDEGFCVFDMLFDRRGRPVDYRFVEVNPSFEKQSGIHAAVGKRMLTLAPQMEPAWFRFYGHVALTGEPRRFVGEAMALRRWFDVYAFRLGGASSRRVAVLFSDITARKQVEADLRQVRAELAAHAAQLEVLVKRRTEQLTETNRALKESVAQIQQKKDALRLLLVASDSMQQKLRLMARQIMTAQEDERRKISRDLHDDVVQTLVSINVELEALTRGAPGGPQFRRKIVRTQRLVEKSVNVVHQFARELRPAVLDDLGLIPALHAHFKQVAERTNLRIHLTAFAGVENLTNHRRTAFYRVALESLANVVRHAHASRVTVTISRLPRAVRMEIHDNGKSFEVPPDLGIRTSKRLGLLGMRERVEMVDGTLTIISLPGKGTNVRAEIPFKPTHPTK